MCFGSSKELFHWDGSFEYPQYMFWMRNKENSFPIHIWRHVLVYNCDHFLIYQIKHVSLRWFFFNMFWLKNKKNISNYTLLSGGLNYCMWKVTLQVCVLMGGIFRKREWAFYFKFYISHFCLIIIIIIRFLINVQVQCHHPHQWAPFQVTG